jgi:hypothetical protein
MTNREKFTDKTITFNGDTWTVGGVGIEQEGNVFCHLWSKTRTICTQKNGRKIPTQACTFVPMEILEAGV